MPGKNWDIAKMQLRVKEAGEDYKERSIDALEISVAEGGLFTQDYLEAAVTKTGLAREEATGGFPGRHLSANMVGSISYDDRTRVSTRAKLVLMAFGWFPGEFEQYFRDQDLGEGNIPAARALPQAFLRARENFRARMALVAAGKSIK
jgi:hypothetical protein